MRNMVSNYYDLMTFGFGNMSFQQFVDRFKEKYNQEQTDGFAWDNEIQIDYTYEQLITSLGIMTLPTYVDAESEGLDKSGCGIIHLKSGYDTYVFRSEIAHQYAPDRPVDHVHTRNIS